jgi:hypothetical protein
MKNFFLLLHALCLLHVHSVIGKEAVLISMEQICKPPYTLGAIKRNDPLFIDDFLSLHSLLRMANPHSIFEIGTCTGEGTLIIKNALADHTVYSLELPIGESSYDIQNIGEACYLPYKQIIGNSLYIDYSSYYPLEAWFIDGAHEYNHVFYETRQALLSMPKIIIWHDADIPEILTAIQDGLQYSDHLLFRINGTRIAFSIPSTSKLLNLIYDYNND